MLQSLTATLTGLADRVLGALGGGKDRRSAGDGETGGDPARTAPAEGNRHPPADDLTQDPAYEPPDELKGIKGG
jgi:hypothetical protein